MTPFLLLTVALTNLFTPPDDGPNTRRRPTPPARTLAAALGRCSGDAYCRACRNCSACGHCAGGGGTCGVCASSAAPVRTYRTPTRSSARRLTSSRAGSSTARQTSIRPTTTVLEENVSYYVATSTLNLRAEPSTEAEVLRVLGAGDIVTVLELVDDTWVKARAESAAEGDLNGYVARAYLSSRR